MKFNSVKFGDCLDLIQNGATIKQFSGGQGIPITRIETLSNNVFNRNKLGYANIFNAEEYSNYILQDYDLLMSHINSRQFLGRTVLYRKNQDEIIIHGMNLLRLKTNNNILDPVFASYYLQTSYFKKCIDSIRKDAINQSSITISDIKELVLFIPSIHEQKSIAKVLTEIDSKIALNISISKELESMAKELYDYWFVQFDFPNLNGKPYKSSGGKMKFNEGLKRNIPSEWEVKKLGNICEIVLGGTPSTSNKDFWNNGTFNWLNSGEVAAFPIVFSEKKITEKALKQSSTEFLKAGSVTLSITRYLRPSILAIDACINQSVVGIKENNTFKNCFIYPYLQNEINRLMSLRTGAQQPHINKETVQESLICIPSMSIMKKYIEKTKAFYEDIINIAKENNKLIALRDELLPMLMNGQVSVKQ